MGFFTGGTAHFVAPAGTMKQLAQMLERRLSIGSSDAGLKSKLPPDVANRKVYDHLLQLALIGLQRVISLLPWSLVSAPKPGLMQMMAYRLPAPQVSGPRWIYEELFDLTAVLRWWSGLTRRRPEGRHPLRA
jgi:hypothetical protein